ncbi:DUF7302 family protein [Streptomyces achromogenes]|uniref:DUF7302 family protein n=1 Tax=Streptomyces achromogenes TaxID=67255 RepID=UPI0036FD81A7
MLIRMLVEMPEGAARNGEPWPAKGAVVDLPTAEAAHLIASGIAEEATEDAGGGEQAPAEQRRGRRRAPAEEEG